MPPGAPSPDLVIDVGSHEILANVRQPGFVVGAPEGSKWRRASS